MSYHLVIQIEDAETGEVKDDPSTFFESLNLAALQIIQNRLAEALLALEEPSDLSGCQPLLAQLDRFIEWANSPSLAGDEL